jgi:alanine dehydrogenase
MTANVPRTSSRVLANAALPFVVEMANNGVSETLRKDPVLGEGVYLYRGKMINEGVAKTLDVPAVSLSELLHEG